MKKRFHPVRHIIHRDLPKQPAQNKADKEQNVFSAYISRTFRRHPLLFGLIVGYILTHFVLNPLFFK